MKILNTYRNADGEALIELVEETLSDGSTVQDVIVYKCRLYPATELQAQTAYCKLVELLDNNNAEGTDFKFGN